MLVRPDGRPTQPDRRTMTRAQIQRFMEFETLLRECGWALVCRKCANFIAGDNDPASPTVSVKCSCREYVFDSGERKH